MIPFRKSIGFRLLGISFIVLALPLLVDSFILIQKRYIHAIADAKGTLIELAQLREIPLSKIQPVNTPVFDVLVKSLDLEQNFPQSPSKEWNERLRKIASVGEFYGIFLLKITEDNRYVVVAAGNEDYIGKDYTDFFNYEEKLFSPEIYDKGYASYISYDSKTLEPYFIVVHVIYSKENKPIGLIAVSDNVTDKLDELLEPDISEYKVNFALLLPSSVVFAASDPDLRFQYFLPIADRIRLFFEAEAPPSKGLLPPDPLHVSNKIGYPFFEFEWKGEEQVGYIKKFPQENFGLLAYTSKKQLFSSPFFDFLNIYSVYGLILLIGGSIAYFLTKRMAKPIQKLSLVMEKIQQGDLDVRYQKDPFGFEINVLGNIFNEMVDTLLKQKSLAEEERIKREIFAEELKLGQQVQRSLLPNKMPHYPGVELANLYVPAIEVGGDFFDFFVREWKGNPQLILAVADASGKGVQACLYSLSVRNMLRTFAHEYEDTASAMVAANNLFCLDTQESGMFVTALMGIYDGQTKILDYFSCGHNPGLVWKEDGRIEILNHMSMAMGLDEAASGKSHTIQLNRGDAVVFYTDGITEAHNEHNHLFGESRLIECLEKHGEKTAAEIVEKIVEAVNAFVGKAPQHDDITLVVMKVKY